MIIGPSRQISIYQEYHHIVLELNVCLVMFYQVELVMEKNMCNILSADCVNVIFILLENEDHLVVYEICFRALNIN